MTRNVEADGAALQRALSIPEFCQRYRVGRGTAYKQIKNGRLKARKCGDRTIIDADDAQTWLRGLPAFNNRTKGGRS